MSESCVCNQNSDIKIFKCFSNLVPIVFHSCKLLEVSYDIHCLDLRALFADLCKLLFHLFLVTSYHANVEALSCKVVAHWKSNSVWTSSNNSPWISMSVLSVKSILRLQLVPDELSVCKHEEPVDPSEYSYRPHKICNWSKVGVKHSFETFKVTTKSHIFL